MMTTTTMVAETAVTTAVTGVQDDDNEGRALTVMRWSEGNDNEGDVVAAGQWGGTWRAKLKVSER